MPAPAGDALDLAQIGLLPAVEPIFAARRWDQLGERGIAARRRGERTTGLDPADPARVVGLQPGLRHRLEHGGEACGVDAPARMQAERGIERRPAHMPVRRGIHDQRRERLEVVVEERDQHARQRVGQRVAERMLEFLLALLFQAQGLDQGFQLLLAREAGKIEQACGLDLLAALAVLHGIGDIGA